MDTAKLQTVTTFQHAIDEWLAESSIGRRSATQRFYREIATTVLAHWHDTTQPVDQISRLNVLKFGNHVTRFCPARWNCICSLLRKITPHGAALKRRKLAVRQFTPPTDRQWRLFIAECEASHPPSHAAIVARFYAHTGLRFSEGRAIEWEHISDDGITTPAHFAKNGRARLIPMIEGLPEIIKELRAISDGSKFVLPRENAKRAIRSACLRAGIPPMSHHCFRHLYATRCIEAGVDIPTVALWLGHQDKGALLAKTYFHLGSEHARRMAARVRITAPPRLEKTVAENETRSLLEPPVDRGTHSERTAPEPTSANRPKLRLATLAA